jgi:hypothetical protein
VNGSAAQDPGSGLSRVRAMVRSDVVAVVGATVVALAVGLVGLRGPTFVDEVSVTNPSEYDIGVRVSGANRDGWLILATASRRSTTATAEVIAQGDVWVFRFSAQGREGGELRITRRALELADWTVTVPDDAIQHLRDEGAPPSP